MMPMAFNIVLRLSAFSCSRATGCFQIGMALSKRVSREDSNIGDNRRVEFTVTLQGSGKATLVSGNCHYPHNPPSALNAAEVAHRQVLLCQAVPRSDLVVAAREVASVAAMPKRVLALTVIDKTLLAPDVMRLRLAPPADESLNRLPGQYLDVLLPGGKRRAFSIANAPHTGREIELHVRHVAGGDFTRHVFADLQPDATLHVEGPLGTFVPREDSERPLLFVAGGTGFAPVKALVEHFMSMDGSDIRSLRARLLLPLSMV